MIQRWNQKLPKCTYCLEDTHTAFKCQKKAQDKLGTYGNARVASSFGGKRKAMKASPIERKTALTQSRKPMKQMSAKYDKLWRATRKEWYETNLPDVHGYWQCYLQISPECSITVDRSTINLEHVLSKVRHPELRFVVSNLRPACHPCNKLKGSKDWVDGVLV